MGFFISTKNCVWKVKSGDCGTEKLEIWDGDFIFFNSLFKKCVVVFFLAAPCNMQDLKKIFYGMLPDTFIDWGAALEAIVRRENIFLPRGDEDEVV